MPDPPRTNRRIPSSPARRTDEPSVGPAYAELRCRSNYSFLEGASHPDELVNRAAELGYSALAITDRNSLAGVVRAHVAARESGLRLLVGALIVPRDGPEAVVLAVDRAGYGRLSRLLSLGRRRTTKGRCLLLMDDVADHAEGLLAAVPLAPLVGGNGDAGLGRWAEAFGDRAYGLAELHLGPDDEELLARMEELAAAYRLPIAAANDVHYHVPDRRYLQDTLTAIRHRTTVEAMAGRLFPNGERYLKPRPDLARRFSRRPDLLARTVEIADRCQFRLDELRYEYPIELAPVGRTPMDYLTDVTWQGAKKRYPAGVPEEVVRLVEKELALIAELKYEAYFLTVWDIVTFARARDILCQGRGAAANSAVCYCLGITSVDPTRINLLFERFVSRERDEPPDIDVDFEHERREEVLAYLYQKYGRDRAALAAAVITYRPKSAVRDVGKALGLSLDCVDRVAKSLEHHADKRTTTEALTAAGLDPSARTTRQLMVLVEQILDFPRHLSQHSGGVVITRGPLVEIVPTENAAMPGRTIVQWDKDDLDALGLLKIDVLCLGMLSAIRRAFDLLRRHGGPDLTLADVPADDPAVWAMLARADTIGVFQIESRAQMAMLPRMKPRCYYDLVIEVSLVRPGPIVGDMVHPYLKRRAGLEAITYPDDRVKGILERTKGVPIFQEQAMQLAVECAGFTPGEADGLRRAMGAWRKRGVMEAFRVRLRDGMVGRGYDEAFAARLYDQIQGFGEYGFPESHAASFALLVWVSSWLKCRHPAAFTCALLNSQPMGFYAPAQLVADAKRHGVEVRPPDVNASDWDSTLEPHASDVGDSVQAWAIRLGLRLIGGLRESEADAIVAARRDGGPFHDFESLAARTGLPSSALRRLARADALRSLSLARRPALWQALPARQQLELFEEFDDALAGDGPPSTLPPMSARDEVLADYAATTLSLKGHPVSSLRNELTRLGAVLCADLAERPTGRRYAIGGIVLLRQRPGTAKGITFMTLEDESGPANLVVRPNVWKAYRRVARTATILLATGRLERRDGTAHLIVDRLADLSDHTHLSNRSRDFH